MAEPLFVSFFGNKNGAQARGWVVLECDDKISTGARVEDLCRQIEIARGYDTGTLVIGNFRRLETDSSDQ